MPDKLIRIAFRTALLYASVGILWITLSDRAIEFMLDDPVAINRMQTYKGWAFVLVTAVGVYLLLHAQLRRWEQASLERQKISQALQDSELRLSTIIRAVQDAVITIDEEQRIRFFNPAAEKLFRCEAADALGHSINKFIPTRFRVAHVEHVRNFAMTSDNVHRIQQNRTVCGLRADGAEVPLEVSISPIKLDGKDLFTITLRDITERREAEIAIQERLKLQERLEKLAATAPGVLISYQQFPDGAAAIPYASPLIEDIYGLRPEDVASDATPAFQLMHPDDLKRVQDSIAKSVETLSLWQTEFRILHPKKGEIWIEGRTMPERQSDGRIIWHGFIQDITERKRAEQALRENEERLRLALAGGHMGTWEWNHLTGRGNVDALEAQLLGWEAKPREYAHEEFMACVHPDDRFDLQTFINKARYENDEYRHEFRIIWQDGTVHWLLTCGQTIFDPEERAVKTIGINYDVTERRQTEEALRQSEERFSRAFRSSPAAFAISRVDDGRFLDINEQFLTLTGLSREEVLGKTAIELGFLKPDDRRRVLQSLQKHSGAVRDIEAKLRTKSGKTHTVLYSLERIELNKEPCLLSILYDITERKQAQETLQRFVACNPAVIYALKLEDGQFRKIWVSENIFDLTGYQAEETENIYWWESHLHPEDQERVLAAHPSIYDTEHQVLEYRFRRKDGTYFWARDDKRLIRDAQGNPAEVVGSWSDISGRVELEEQLRQSQKLEAIGQLAGGVAHDFNNLLTVIMGYSEMLLRKLPSGDPARNQVATIRQAGERAASLTRQLLAFSRKQVLAPKVLDLNDVVANIEKMLRRLIGEDIILKTILSPSINPVKVDPGQIEQVVINLAVNARDAMPQGGELTIETRDIKLDDEVFRHNPLIAPGHYTQLLITDTGCGMSPEIKARIFEPFFTTKGVGKGTGLGLATVFGIIKQSDGYLDVDSAVNIGTTFRIYLPAVEVEELGVSSISNPEIIPQGNETILLVEDEDGVRQIAKLTLEMNGYKVLEASNGRDAITLVENFDAPIHLLITDIVMPGIGGRQVTEQVQAHYPDLKVLYMSGYIDDALVRHGITLAKEAFLQKPFLPAALAQKVHEVLNHETSG